MILVNNKAANETEVSYEDWYSISVQVPQNHRESDHFVVKATRMNLHRLNSCFFGCVVNNPIMKKSALSEVHMYVCRVNRK